MADIVSYTTVDDVGTVVSHSVVEGRFTVRSHKTRGRCSASKACMMRPLGIHHLDMPLTRNKIWHAIRSAQRRG